MLIELTGGRMALSTLVDLIGEARTSALGGLVIGCFFGFCAQKSRFCLRAAAVEFSRGRIGAKVSIWLVVFATALLGTQGLIAYGVMDISQTRQLAAQGSLSGAALGGLCFGFGMVMARGCASRLLVLSANGNLRALLSGLVFAVMAQASYRGLLSPLREALSGLWLVDGGQARDIMTYLGGNPGLKPIFAVIWMAGAAYFSWQNRIGLTVTLYAAGAGLAVVAGWIFSYNLAQTAFTPSPIKSLTFSGPSADVLMYVLTSTDRAVDFDIALVPGVFIGSFTAAALAGELKIEGFSDGLGMRRYIAGASLMGFGAMLAGGCAVGAGVTGASVFALTAWIVLIGMWVGAAISDAVFDRP